MNKYKVRLIMELDVIDETEPNPYDIINRVVDVVTSCDDRIGHVTAFRFEDFEEQT